MRYLIFLAAFLVAIGILVAVHEFGHYWVAKKLGFKFTLTMAGYNLIRLPKLIEAAA